MAWNKRNLNVNAFDCDPYKMFLLPRISLTTSAADDKSKKSRCTMLPGLHLSNQIHDLSATLIVFSQKLINCPSRVSDTSTYFVIHFIMTQIFQRYKFQMTEVPYRDIWYFCVMGLYYYLPTGFQFTFWISTCQVPCGINEL